jgi:hypothetical protein
MKKTILLFLFFAAAKLGSAQKVDSIYFHLYTDSLKKGYFNYINIDGKMTDGTWIPLSANDLILTVEKDTALRFEKNDLFIDSSYTKETVTVKAVLKENPKVWKEVTIYIRKRGFDEPLKSNQEHLDDLKNERQKSKKKNLTSSLRLQGIWQDQYLSADVLKDQG